MEETKEVKKLKKLAIVGCAESKVLAPFQDESYEIWGMNNLYGYIPRWTRWFEIHPLAFNGKEYTRRGNPNFRGLSVTKYLQSIGAMKCQVYLQKLFPEIMPNGILYPLKEILEMFPRRYFTNSVSYMIALGIMEKFDVIDIYGVDMAVDTEYFWQRASCEYFIGLAEGMGIKVYLPDTAHMLKAQFLYGFEEDKESFASKTINGMLAGMEQRKANEMKKAEISNNAVQQYIGAISCAKEIHKMFKTV